MMSLGEDTALICFDVIKEKAISKKLKSELTDSGRTVIDISIDQMKNFLGNALEVRSKNNEKYANTYFDTFQLAKIHINISNEVSMTSGILKPSTPIKYWMLKLSIQGSWITNCVGDSALLAEIILAGLKLLYSHPVRKS